LGDAISDDVRCFETQHDMIEITPQSTGVGRDCAHAPVHLGHESLHAVEHVVHAIDDALGECRLPRLQLVEVAFRDKRVRVVLRAERFQVIFRRER